MMPEDATVKVHPTRVDAGDGLSMALDLFVPAEVSAPLPVTVLCHGFKGFRLWGMFPDLARRLAAGGRAVALFDFSHNGTGDDPQEFTRLDLFEQQTLTRHVRDLGLVLDALHADPPLGEGSLDPHRLFVVGHSMGGGVAVLRAVEDRRIQGLALLNSVSTFQRFPEEALREVEATGRVLIPNARTGQQMPLGRAWFEDLEGVDLLAQARQLALPCLVVQGAVDPNVVPAEGRALAESIPDARLFLVEEGDHTFGAKHPWAGWTAPLAVVADQLDGFLPAMCGR